MNEGAAVQVQVDRHQRTPRSPRDQFLGGQRDHSKAPRQGGHVRHLEAGALEQLVAFKQVAHRTVEQLAPLAHQHRAAGVLGHQPRRMGDNHDCRASAVEAVNQVHHAALLRIVQSGGWLIKD